MSGQKVTYRQITTDEYNNLMKSATIANSMDRTVKDAIAKNEKSLKKDFDSRLDAVNSRNTKQEKIINNLGSDMKIMEKDFQKQYKAQNAQHQKDIGSLNNSMKNMKNDFQKDIKTLDKKVDAEVKNIYGTLKTQRDEYTTLIKQQGEELNGKIKDITDSIKRTNDQQSYLAQEWIKNANDALALVATYRYNKFAPNEYENLVNSLKLSQQNIRNRVYQASIASSQQVWIDAYKLRAKLEGLESEWDMYYKMAKRSNADLNVTYDTHKEMTFAFDMADETPQELKVDIDKWSMRELSKLNKEKIEPLKKALENKDDELSIHDLKNAIQASNAYKNEIIAIAQTAKSNMILSQERTDIASDIVNKLSENGYEYQDACYEYDDQRETYCVKLENPLGEEIVIRIEPAGMLDNKIDILFYDNSVSEDLTRNRLNAIIGSISNDEATCTQPTCVRGTTHQAKADPKFKNFDQIKEKGVSPRQQYQQKPQQQGQGS